MQWQHNLITGVNTIVELQNTTTTSDNSITLLSQNIPRWMSLLLDAVVIFFSSIIVLTPNGQFLDYAIIAFGQQYVSIIVNPPQNTNISFN
jgi:hypothetical protein